MYQRTFPTGEIKADHVWNKYLQQRFIQQQVVACNDYTWGNTLLNESGQYSDTTQTVNGCDSITTLNLTIVVLNTSIVGLSEVDYGSTQSYECTSSSTSQYQWGTNGGTINQDSSANVTVQWYSAEDMPNESNRIWVIQTDENNCVTDTAYLTINFNTNTEIDKLDYEKILLYPNPTNKMLNINFGGLDVKTIRFIDMQGKIIDQVNVGQQKVFKHDVQNYARGIYFVKILCDDQWHEFKFIKK